MKKTKQNNFNTIINHLYFHSSTNHLSEECNSHSNSLYQLQPSNLAVHNLCKTKQPPSGTKNLLGLGLKFCTVPPKPHPS